MNVIWKGSPNYSYNMGPKTGIVIHWWNDPAKKPTLSGTVNWLCNPAARVSAHYVVSDKTVYRLVDEKNVAWHSLQANPYTIGIEVDPRTPGATYDTVIELVRGICSRHGLNPLTDIKPHNYYVQTTCPGTLDLHRIRTGAAQQGGQEEMRLIIVRPISTLKVKLKKPIQMFNLETGAGLHNSGLYMEVDQKALVNGHGYLIPTDRSKKGQLYGFREGEVLAKGNEVHDTQFDSKPPAPFDDRKALTIYQQAREKAGNKYPGGAEKFAADRLQGKDNFQKVMDKDMAFYIAQQRVAQELLSKDIPAPISAQDQKDIEVGRKFRAVSKEAING